MSDWIRIKKNDRLFEEVKKIASGGPSSVTWIGSGDESFYAWFHVPSANIVLVSGESEQFDSNGQPTANGEIRTQIHYPSQNRTVSIGVAGAYRYGNPFESFQTNLPDFYEALRNAAAAVADNLTLPMDGKSDSSDFLEDLDGLGSAQV